MINRKVLITLDMVLVVLGLINLCLVAGDGSMLKIVVSAAWLLIYIIVALIHIIQR